MRIYTTDEILYCKNKDYLRDKKYIEVEDLIKNIKETLNCDPYIEIIAKLERDLKLIGCKDHKSILND